MRVPIRLRTAVWAVLLALWTAIASTGSEPPKQPDTVVFSKGIKGGFQHQTLRPATLEFGDTSLGFKILGEYPERFDYEQIQVRKGSVSRHLPFSDKTSWLLTLPAAGLFALTSGPLTSALYLGPAVGVPIAFHFAGRLFKGHSRHWMSLHSKSRHRCVFLWLPRNKRARLAISELLETRSPKELLVRPPPTRRGLILRSGGPMVGETVPAFSATTVDGSKWSLSQFRGKLIVVNFWATWCGPCRKELPELEQLHEVYSQQGLEVVGVSNEDPDVIREFLTAQAITFPTLDDGDHQLHHLYDVTSLPTTLVIGQDGTLLDRIEGYAGNRRLTKVVTALLKKARSTAAR